MKDPVCGMEVPEPIDYTTTYDGLRYAFCSEECKEQFNEEPEKFLTMEKAGEKSR